MSIQIIEEDPDEKLPIQSILANKEYLFNALTFFMDQGQSDYTQTLENVREWLRSLEPRLYSSVLGILGLFANASLRNARKAIKETPGLEGSFNVTIPNFSINESENISPFDKKVLTAQRICLAIISELSTEEN